MPSAWDAVASLDEMVGDVMGAVLGTATSPRPFEPSFDVRATHDDIVFVCDVPGVKESELEVTVEDHVLTIRGARHFEAGDDEQLMLGRAYGRFTRAFSLPHYLDEANLSAQLQDGVLTIRIPKLPSAKKRKIRIGTISGPKRLKE